MKLLKPNVTPARAVIGQRLVTLVRTTVVFDLRERIHTSCPSPEDS